MRFFVSFNGIITKVIFNKQVRLNIPQNRTEKIDFKNGVATIKFKIRFKFN